MLQLEIWVPSLGISISSHSLLSMNVAALDDWILKLVFARNLCEQEMRCSYSSRVGPSVTDNFHSSMCYFVWAISCFVRKENINNPACDDRERRPKDGAQCSSNQFPKNRNTCEPNMEVFANIV